MTRIILCLLLLSACGINQPELEGSYMLIATKSADSALIKEDTAKRKTIKVIRNGFWISATFSGNKKVIVEKASGGTYTIKNDQYIETINYSSVDESLVGKVYSYNYKLHNGNYVFYKITKDDNCKNCLSEEEYLKNKSDNKLKDTSLEGVWKVGYNEWFGKKVEDSDFTNYKIYIYPRFAWGSYHARGKDFIGTAGGTYQFDGKKLVEHVEYFSFYEDEAFYFPADITKFSSDSILQVSMDGAGKEIYTKVK